MRMALISSSQHLQAACRDVLSEDTKLGTLSVWVKSCQQNRGLIWLDGLIPGLYHVFAVERCVCVCACACEFSWCFFAEWRLQSTHAWLHYFWREQRSRKATSDTPRNLLILTCKEKSRYPTRNHPCNPCNLCNGKKSSARHCKARIPKSTSIIWHQIISNHDHACDLSFKALSLCVGQKDLLNDTWHWDHWAAAHDPPAISGTLWFQCLGLLNPHGVSMWDHVGSDP